MSNHGHSQGLSAVTMVEACYVHGRETKGFGFVFATRSRFEVWAELRETQALF